MDADSIENHGVPSSISHLIMLHVAGGDTQQETISKIDSYSHDLKTLGVSMCALYQAATCHRGCRGKGHLFEAISGRTYNLACSAYNLILLGFYDEALSLTRSIGEVVNLLTLSYVDRIAFQAWIDSDTKTRLRKFSPARVRELLANSGNVPILADFDWYSDLCEKYVHVTPATRPGLHGGQASVGGIFQDAGIKSALNELTTMTASAALLISRMFGFDDLFEDITKSARDS